MSTEELTMRFISSTTGIDHYRVINGDLEPEELQDINRRIGNLETDNLIIEDTPKLTTYDIRSIARRLIKTHGIKGIMIDYLQIMGDRNPDNTLYKKNTDNVANCKAIAKELNIPVILFSQLSRSVENRTIKRPMLSDLRESGAIEENSDQVLFLYRPEYYGILEDEEGKPTDGVTETIIGKNRHGSLGTVTEKANFDTFSFTDAPF
jgi:replicative DNA helicase